MKVSSKKIISEEKVCKKCGDPLTSNSKYKYCDNCRREKAKTKKTVLTTFAALGIAVISVVPGVKHFKGK